MADNKRSRRKKKYFKSNTKTCQPRRMTSEGERTFQESIWKIPEVTDKPTKIIFNYQEDTKLGQFKAVELDAVLKKITSRKVTGLDEIPPEV